ncbi:MAG TPA: histidinol dehydrogenase [Gemmatimonadales bacterium]
MTITPVTPTTVRLRRYRVPPLSAIAELLAVGRGAGDAATRETVAGMLEAVRVEGDAAILRFQRDLDGVDLTPAEWEVPRAAWEAARARLDPALRGALERAAARVRAFHEDQREASRSWLDDDGTLVGTRVLPLDAAGVYVPGGTASYPSSVLMNVIPAVVAGVREIVAVTPPGGVTDAVLAACEIAGVTRLFRIGGAQACAALAYGTATVPRVDKLVGPGNRWVAEAKRQLAGVVGMDMVAGPTEVLIVADAAARPAHVAADLLAHAEHDREASAWLVTPDEELVAAVERELEARLATAPRAGIAREALARNGVAVLVPDLATAITVANRRAPEHLELLVEDADRWLDAVRHAGAVFVGPFTPEPVGDYVAGPSHVLPTGGSARFASPLGVYDFVKRMSVVRYSAARLARDVADVVILARAEGLDGHAEAVLARHPGPR